MEVVQTAQQELAALHAIGMFDHPRANALKLAIEDAGHEMTTLAMLGVIQKNPLKLTEVS
jgi:hypothetical protein